MQEIQQDGKIINIKPAVTWLLKCYLDAQNDKPQAMYRFKRRHDLFDILLDERTHKQRFKEKQAHYLSESERETQVQEAITFVKQQAAATKQDIIDKRDKLKNLVKYYKRDERKIRYSISQDMLLYLQAKQYLADLQFSSGSKPVWNLQGIETTLLKNEIRHQLDVPNSNKHLFHPTCKIRNMGELTLLVRDRRLQTLLDYYREDETGIHHDEIRAELNSYRRAKVAIMRMTHELENQIIATLGHVAKRDKTLSDQTSEHFGRGRHGDFLYALYQHHQSMSNGADVPAFSLDSFDQTLRIRNAFSHNQYPEVDKFNNIAAQVRAENVPENPANQRKVADRFKQCMEDRYIPWLNFLKGVDDV